MSASTMNVHCQVILSKPLSTSREWRILASNTTLPLERFPEPGHPCDGWEGALYISALADFSCLCAKPLIFSWPSQQHNSTKSGAKVFVCT